MQAPHSCLIGRIRVEVHYTVSNLIDFHKLRAE